MSSPPEHMVAALLEVSRYCVTCQRDEDPVIDDCFIVCGACGRIKRKVTSA